MDRKTITEYTAILTLSAVIAGAAAFITLGQKSERKDDDQFASVTSAQTESTSKTSSKAESAPQNTNSSAKDTFSQAASSADQTNSAVLADASWRVESAASSPEVQTANNEKTETYAPEIRNNYTTNTPVEVTKTETFTQYVPEREIVYEVYEEPTAPAPLNDVQSICAEPAEEAPDYTAPFEDESYEVYYFEEEIPLSKEDTAFASWISGSASRSDMQTITEFINDSIDDLPGSRLQNKVPDSTRYIYFDDFDEYAGIDDLIEMVKHSIYINQQYNNTLDHLVGYEYSDGYFRIYVSNKYN